MSDVGSSEQTNQPLVWIKVEDLEPGDGDAIAQGIQDIVPDHEVIVTTDELELIDAHEMKDVLERMLDDD